MLLFTLCVMTNDDGNEWKLNFIGCLKSAVIANIDAGQSQKNKYICTLCFVDIDQLYSVISPRMEKKLRSLNSLLFLSTQAEGSCTCSAISKCIPF